MKWKLVITNDPRHDYRLVFELWEDQEVRAQVEDDCTGRLVLTIFPTSAPYGIPVEWLSELLAQAKAELPVTS